MFLFYIDKMLKRKDSLKFLHRIEELLYKKKI